MKRDPVTQGRILRELHKGAVIRVMIVNYPPSEAGTFYRLSSTNQYLKPAQVAKLLADKLIKPNKDGLFEDGPVQSYSLFRASEGGA